MSADRPKMPRPVVIADLLGSAFQGKPVEQRLREAKIWLLWESAVGGQIAAKAHPVAFRNGTLVVAVANAPWLQQLNFLKKKLIEKLNSSLGSPLIDDIQLRAGSRKETIPATPAERRSIRKLSAAENLRVKEEAERIADTELRDRFAALLAKHLGTEAVDPD